MLLGSWTIITKTASDMFLGSYSNLVSDYGRSSGHEAMSWVLLEPTKS